MKAHSVQTMTHLLVQNRWQIPAVGQAMVTDNNFAVLEGAAGLCHLSIIEARKKCKE